MVATLQLVKFIKSEHRRKQKQFEELKEYFDTVKEYPDTILLEPCATITDVSHFLKSHISIVENNISKKRYLPYLERLEKVAKIMQSKKGTLRRLAENSLKEFVEQAA